MIEPTAAPILLSTPTIGEKIHYELDRLLLTNAASRFILLATISGLLVVFGALLRIIFAQSGSVGIFSALWWAVVRVINTGTFASEETYTDATIAFFCTLSGWFVVASLIGMGNTFSPAFLQQTSWIV